MLPIKYKVWDKVNKEMLNVDFLNKDFVGYEDKNRSGTIPIKNAVFFQHTGIKDRYAGDILRIEGRNFVILWNKSECQFQVWMIEIYSMRSVYSIGDGEVIGHMMENPELMKG